MNFPDLQKVAKTCFQKRDLLVKKSCRKQAANPRSHANVQSFAVIHVFESLIEGFRSWEYRSGYQLDLLYILNFSNPKKVNFRRKSYFCQKVVPRRCLLGNIFDKLRIQGRMHIFEKMSQSALNHVLILQLYRTQKMLQIPLKNIDLQYDFNILVANSGQL